MNILFLHGLESNLSDNKKLVLEKYGAVFAPKMDYFTNPNMIATIFKDFKNNNIDILIGSSMGGFTAYYLAQLFQKPALLFNPALPARPVIQNIPEVKNTNENLLQFVLGAKDDIVPANKNLKFIINSLNNYQDIKIHLINDLEHRIPLDTFTKEVDHFFKSL